MVRVPSLSSSPGAHFKLCRQIFLLHDERMVTSGRHGRGQAMENGLIIVNDCACFAVHQARSAHHVSAKSRADGLMSKADTKNGYLCRQSGGSDRC